MLAYWTSIGKSACSDAASSPGMNLQINDFSAAKSATYGVLGFSTCYLMLPQRFCECAEQVEDAPARTFN